MHLTKAQALAWRLGRHHLVSGAGTAAEVVRRLVAVPAWSGDPARAVGRRLEGVPAGGDPLAEALDSGAVLRTYAWRGATHLMAPDVAARHLAVRCAGRQWERRSWQEHYGLTPGDWPDLRAAVRTAVADGPATRAELVAAVCAHPRFAHLGSGLMDRSDTLLKPLAWQGDLCFGPPRGEETTYVSPASLPGWPGLPDLEVAGPDAVRDYVGAYGPATRERLHYWLVEGMSAGRRRLEGWVASMLGDGSLVEVDLDGRPALVDPSQLDDLAAVEPQPHVALVPAYDQWVLGPGTADPLVVPPARRDLLSRGAAAVLSGGRVAGTWRLERGTLAVAWFEEEPQSSTALLEAEVDRWRALLGREVGLVASVG